MRTGKGLLSMTALARRPAAFFRESAEGPPAAAGGRGGFTLLEVVTAIFIFFCGIVGILSLFTTALVLHKSSKDKTISSFVLEQVVLEVRELVEKGALEKGDAGRLEPVSARPVAGYPGYFYSVEFPEGPAGTGGGVPARIRIQWKARGRVMGETFETLFRPGPGLRWEVMKMRAESG